jgi:hypothetical protein
MAYRAYRLCNRATWIPITVLVLSLASSGASLATLIIFYNLNSLVDAVSAAFTTSWVRVRQMS